MKEILILFYILFFNIGFAQNSRAEIKSLKGIWIAEDYYNSFEKTKSAIQSKNAFSFNDPVALRINPKEIRNGILNIGYSVLHDHSLYPEVSEYLVKDKDTINEQGSFKINLKSKDSLGYHKTTDISYFNFDWISYITWNTNDNTISLYKPKGNKHEEEYITFKRVTTEFKRNYLYPNPLYYYTRSRTLSGNYTLKDNFGNILSDNFTIRDDGVVNGFNRLNNFVVYFSTDIYCGPPSTYDLVMFFDNILNEEAEVFYFLYRVNEKGTIDFYKRLYNEEDGSQLLGERIYELVKNNDSP